MNYLVSKFPCKIDDCGFSLQENVRYKIDEPIENLCVSVFGENKILSKTDGIVSFNFEGDNYSFLFFAPQNFFDVQFLNLNNTSVFISVTNRLKISIDNVRVIDEEVGMIEFSQVEKLGEFSIIYFEGERKFVVILKGKEVCGYGYYDEINKKKDEIYFMCRLKDSLNHGRVFHISTKFEEYLVYLDDFELKLKPEFVHLVFLDCMLANNLKYCNALLDEGLKQKDEKEIKNFFCDFDYFFPLKNCAAACFKKNALVGIYKFEISNCSISNIVYL